MPPIYASIHMLIFYVSIAMQFLAKSRKETRYAKVSCHDFEWWPSPVSATMDTKEYSLASFIFCTHFFFFLRITLCRSHCAIHLFFAFHCRCHIALPREVLKDEDLQNFFNQTRGFLIACTQTQIQLSPQTFVGLCKKFTDAATRLCVPIQGVAPLQLAASKLLEGRAKRTLTPIDADVLQLCLLAGTRSKEKHVDGLHMYEVDPMNTCLTPMDFGVTGTILNGAAILSNGAIDCFRIVISSPAQ